MFFPKDFYIFTMVYRRIIMCFSRLHVWAAFLNFCSWSTTMYQPETIACHIEYYYHLTPYWPHPTMHTQASFSMYGHFIQYVWTIMYSNPLSGQLTAIGIGACQARTLFLYSSFCCLPRSLLHLLIRWALINPLDIERLTAGIKSSPP